MSSVGEYNTLFKIKSLRKARWTAIVRLIVPSTTVKWRRLMLLRRNRLSSLNGADSWAKHPPECSLVTSVARLRFV